MYEQLLEGIGLGASIAGASEIISRTKCVLMVVSFAISFPVGICIGIGLTYLEGFEYGKPNQQWTQGACTHRHPLRHVDANVHSYGPSDANERLRNRSIESPLIISWPQAILASMNRAHRPWKRSLCCPIPSSRSRATYPVIVCLSARANVDECAFMNCERMLGLKHVVGS